MEIEIVARTPGSEYVVTVGALEVCIGSYQFPGQGAVVRASCVDGAACTFRAAWKLLQVLEAGPAHGYEPVGVHVTNHLDDDDIDVYDGIWFERRFPSKKDADEFAARRAQELRN